MKTIKLLTLIVVAMLAVSLGGCMDSDDVQDIVEYNLRIENGTDAAYDIWIDNPLTNHGPYPAGHVAANQHALVHELDIGINYTVHLVAPGDVFDNAIFQRNVHSSGGDITWNVN